MIKKKKNKLNKKPMLWPKNSQVWINYIQNVYMGFLY